MIQTTSTEPIETFVNQPLERLAGVYFENLADLHIFRDHWKFINYVNLAPLEGKEKILKFFIDKIDILCYIKYGKHEITCSGSQELERLQRKMKSLKVDRETVNDLIGRSDDVNNKQRKKRGVFDFVGQIAKILFGTLDSTDADYYNDQIDLVYNNSKQLTDLYKKQINIIQSTIGNFSIAFRENNHKFKEIDYNIGQLHKIMLKNEEKMNEAQMNIMVNSYLIECTEMIFEYELELEILTDAILLARRGLIHPKILSPKELFKHLKETRFVVDDKQFPVPLEPNQFTNLIDVSDISIFYKNHRLIYVIEIPLIEQNNFILYHAIPLPIKQNERGIYAFINPSYAYLGLRSDKQLYTHLTEHDLAKCKKINNVRICKQTDLLYQVSAVQNCESELLKSARLESIMKECDIRVTRIHNTVWYQLKTTNSWLYTAPRNETLHILCKDNKPRQTKLFSTGIISLSSDCDAISDNALLRSQTIGAISTVEKDYIPDVKLNTSKLCEDLKERNINFSDIHLLNIGKTPNLDIHVLEAASSALNEIYKEADEISKHHRTRTLYQKAVGWFYYALYTIGGLVILYLTAKFSLISKCFNIFKLCCVPKEGCVQYFNNCFNNSVRTRRVHPPNNPRQVVTFTAVPTEIVNEIPQYDQIYKLGKNSGTRRSRSHSRNDRLTNLM